MNEDRESTIYTTCVYFTCQVIKMFSICRLLVRNVFIMQYATYTHIYVYYNDTISSTTVINSIIFIVMVIVIITLVSSK